MSEINLIRVDFVFYKVRLNIYFLSTEVEKSTEQGQQVRWPQYFPHNLPPLNFRLPISPKPYFGPQHKKMIENRLGSYIIYPHNPTLKTVKKM